MPKYIKREFKELFDLNKKIHIVCNYNNVRVEFIRANIIIYLNY